ncbi:MAG: hypothetical protein KJZ75_01365 [Hyphomonadaceae bacterium]|nr:hypothetical protein [Hyphomonadaceae bacterium]GIK50092.1 MAG: pilus assembly protein TadG [Alphaproteobacteria bacterium]
MSGQKVGAFGLRRFARSRRGNVAMLWALMGTVLIGLIGLTVDFTRAQAIRAQLQNAADGAALVAERNANLPEAERIAAAQAFFEAEMGEYADEVTEFRVVDMGEVGHRVEAAIPMPVTLARLIRNESWTIRVQSEAEQGGRDIEVAVVVDTTGSMAGSRITALRAAATDLVNIIVSDEQEPYYSKVALVPYSIAVNLGSYASSARGSLTGPRSISDAAWASSPQRSISGATRANPVVITANGHGFSNGDRVRIRNVNGMTQLNNNTYTVHDATTNTFKLRNASGQNVNGSNYNNYTSGGNVTRCTRTDCEVVVTANSHGLSTNDYVFITGVNGMTQINNGNNAAWQVTVIDSNSYQLNASNGPSYSNYTSGGSSYCAQYGCEYFRFLNPSGSQRRYRANNCVTERTGQYAYTDVSPMTAPVGIHYPGGSDPCDSVEVMPLTSDRTALNARIATLNADGYTAGQIGIGWGWYMLSPTFGQIFPVDNRPADYDPDKVLKVAVLMTDGEFNTEYCNGVVARDASSVSSNNRISCNASNGDGFTQARAMCDAMKAQGIVIYSVGFGLSAGSEARSVMEYCASGASRFKDASSGDELRQAFQQIARAIQELRLTH